MRKLNLVVFVFAIILNSCATSSYSPFKLVDKNYKPKGKRLAIISALFREDTKVFTKKFENEYMRSSKYNIISQNKIKKKLGLYPIKIRGPYKTALQGIDEDYTNTDVKTLINMGKKLNVDYIYAIWIPSREVVLNYDIYQLHTILQIFDVSTEKEIAHMKFPIMWQTEGTSIGAKLKRNKIDAMNEIAIKLSEHIAEKMDMLKDNK